MGWLKSICFQTPNCYFYELQDILLIPQMSSCFLPLHQQVETSLNNPLLYHQMPRPFQSVQLHHPVSMHHYIIISWIFQSYLQKPPCIQCIHMWWGLFPSTGEITHFLLCPPVNIPRDSCARLTLHITDIHLGTRYLEKIVDNQIQVRLLGAVVPWDISYFQKLI